MRNTVLLANHGIVCWADTVTHAEWYAEVMETYCWTLMIASQMGAHIVVSDAELSPEYVALLRDHGIEVLLA
jgi:L-fuculose-phosphate aldolase